MRNALACAALAAILAHAAPAAAQVDSVSVAGRLSFDAGTVFVSGTETGLGGGVGVRLAFGDERAVWEVGAELDVAGYTGQGDGDPIFTAAVLASYRGFSDGEGFRAYWTAGIGVGAVGVAGAGFVLPFKVGAGFSIGHHGPAGLQVGVFNRYNLVLTGDNPSKEFLNSLGVEAAVRFGR